MKFVLATVLFVVLAQAKDTEPTVKKPLCSSCLITANAVKNANKNGNIKNNLKTACSTITKNEQMCSNAVNAASIYLTITPADKLCAQVQLCSASSTGLLGGLSSGIQGASDVAAGALGKASDVATGALGSLSSASGKASDLASGTLGSLTSGISSASSGLTSGLGSIRKTRQTHDEIQAALQDLLDFFNNLDNVNHHGD
ncbi:unnamed protein product [Caenorhabditis angaria]|uniref:Uncharacterized protein n=1 Tax=Caenorhabditis angaria TaxID=860376 RepID=A0A9P1N4D9_9PELO|nr:unnamed protein product [Caenorhabditis angaria]